MMRQLLIAGRQIPGRLLRVPGNRRLKEITVAIDQVAAAAHPGADGKRSLSFGLADDLAFRVGRRLPMNHLVAPALDLISETQTDKRAFRDRVVTLDRRRVLHWGKRTAHGMLVIRLGLVAMTSGTGLIADVFDFGPNIEKGRGISEAGVRWDCSCRFRSRFRIAWPPLPGGEEASHDDEADSEENSPHTHDPDARKEMSSI